MSKILQKPIVYLESTDILQDGSIVNSTLLSKNIPIVLMIQANYCGYCTMAKPEFQSFANQTQGKVSCATIQGDLKLEGVSNINNVKELYPDFKGYPYYILFNSSGKRVPREIQSRDMNGLKSFVGL